MSDERPTGDVPHTSLEGDQRGRVYAEGYLDSESRIEGSSARTNMRLWIAVLGAAIIWFLQLQTSYSLVVYACASGAVWALHAASLLFLILAAIPGWIGWQHWKLDSQANNKRKSTHAGRQRFMALLGLMLTGLFLLLILAQAIPSFFFDPCLN
jgi:hypothetical protein